MKYHSASDTTIGLRSINQDRCLEFTFKGVKVMMLCDGNGGDGGEVVADYAVRFLSGEIVRELSRMEQIKLKKLLPLGEEAIRHTAEAIDHLKSRGSDFASCGTTLTLVFIYKAAVITFWVGDSPAMLFQHGELTRLASPPHTLAELLIEQGESRENVMKQPSLSSTLTRCIGFKNATPSVNIVRPKPPFSVVIASDGINYIPEDMLQKIFAQVHMTTCLPKEIIASALEHGSDDNITVVATKVKARLKPKMRKNQVARKRRGYQHVQ